MFNYPSIHWSKRARAAIAVYLLSTRHSAWPDFPARFHFPRLLYLVLHTLSGRTVSSTHRAQNTIPSKQASKQHRRCPASTPKLQCASRTRLNASYWPISSSEREKDGREQNRQRTTPVPSKWLHAKRQPGALGTNKTQPRFWLVEEEENCNTLRYRFSVKDSYKAMNRVGHDETFHLLPFRFGPYVQKWQEKEERKTANSCPVDPSLVSDIVDPVTPRPE